MNEDEGHLNNLAIAHYVLGGVSALFSLFPLIHVTIGIAMLSGHFPAGEGGKQMGPTEASFVGWLFVIIGSACILIAEAVSICIIVSGRFLKQRRNYMFSFVLACIMCAFFPFGTILGIFTILVLSKDSVKQIYGRPVTRTVPPPVAT